MSTPLRDRYERHEYTTEHLTEKTVTKKRNLVDG